MSVETVRTEKVVGVKAGLDAWAQHAFLVLADTAREYNATITYTDLAEEVQRRSGLRTTVASRSWVGKVLEVVVGACHQAGMPPLTSLVVHKTDGSVGAAYDAVLRTMGAEPIEDAHERELHAAAARLECYRRYCDTVPEDAEPTLVVPVRKTAPVRTPGGGTRRPAANRPATKPSAHPEPAPLPFCERCFTQLPAVGQGCNYCD